MNILSQKPDIFHTIKQEIPIADVVRAFYSDTTRNKINCPFHQESRPSLHVYEDSFYCFGCGAYGDAIDFVAKLHDLQLIDAARLIADKFNLPVDKKPSIDELKRAEKIARRRSAAKKYKELEIKAFRNMADYRSLVLKTIEICGLDNLSPSAERAAHKLPQIEHYMQVIVSGTTSERLELLREGVLTKWSKTSVNI